MAATDPPAGTSLSQGDVIAGARLVEPVARGERVVCWRAEGAEGQPLTVHVLAGAEHPRERDNFVKGARKLAVLTRDTPVKGVVEIITVVPEVPAYLARGGTAGTMDDLSILGWGVRETLRFMRRLCRALTSLHQSGIHHGCLRPANVLLDDDLNPRLSDVGMIVLDDSFDGPSDMKHDYSAYAAREVRLGKKPDARSDVYSVGRLLYFALHGETPEETDEDTPLLAALENAPPGLVRIIRRATLRAPEGRYGSIAELSADLEHWREVDRVGLQHPRGREGGLGEEPHGAGDSDPPSYPDRPSRSASSSSSGRAPDSERTPPPAERKPPPVPIRSYHAPPPPEDDVVTPVQARVGGAIGALILCGALMTAYAQGMATNVVVVASVVGAVVLSLLFPPIAAPLPSRFLNALIFGLVAWYLDPATLLAERGREQRLSTGTPAARGIEVKKLKARGVRDLSGSQLAGVDFKRLDLSFLSFDRCVLSGASFVDAKLHAVTFAEAELSGADFSGADLSGVNMAPAKGWRDALCSETTVMPAGWVCDEGKPLSEAAVVED